MREELPSDYELEASYSNPFNPATTIRLSLPESAYVFERQGDGSWLEVDKLTASDGAENGQFGISVCVDETLALVGAWLDDDLGTNSGSAHDAP